MNTLFVFVFFISAASYASVRFNCYDNPGLPLLSYQVGGVNCPARTQKGALDNTQNVFCVYSALCEPLADGEVATELTSEQVERYSTDFAATAQSTFKYSTVSCAGIGILDNNGVLLGNCPAISECAKDVAYNGSAAVANGVIQKKRPQGRVIIDKPNMEKTGTKK